MPRGLFLTAGHVGSDAPPPVMVEVVFPLEPFAFGSYFSSLEGNDVRVCLSIYKSSDYD